MPLSWNEIRTRAISFVKEWEGESRERAEKDSFWNDFFNVFGISRRRVATFEEPVKKLNNNYGFIDLFWKGKLLIEHKSKGKDLSKAYTQALEYFEGLKERELPKYILVSDFERFKLYDLDNRNEKEFTLNEFVDNIHLFGFIAGYEKRVIEDEAPVNIEAAEKMGFLHDKLKEVGYEGYDLEVLLVRLLFCLFADDTGIFNTGIFQEYIDLHTKEDGSDLAMHIAQIFQTLDTPIERRQKNLDENLNQFPYVNGELFTDNIRIAHFDSEMRELVLEAGAMDWGEISPAIFGSMFQAAMNPKERRNLGAHYTSEKNIMKVIKPLFLDDLWEEFNKLRKTVKTLQAFHNKIASLNFLDPACGSGNFLIITYRELRLLEIEVVKALLKIQFKGLNADFTTVPLQSFLKVSITQFYGIEIDEFASKVAEVGMWLIEHQINEQLSLEFGQNIINLPLKGVANITNANALRIDWDEVVRKEELSYIIGNPPFYGQSLQTIEQKKDLESVCAELSGSGILDFVAGWFVKAADFIQNSMIEVGFVSTNSITQGEQVGILWNRLVNQLGIKINFAHRTFNWSNKAKGNAAVHVVIIGFAIVDKEKKFLFDYSDIKGEPTIIQAKQINAYLLDAKNCLVVRRKYPISEIPKIKRGNSAYDGGNLIFQDEEELTSFLTKEPDSKEFIKPLIGAKEFLNNKKRWCLWLKDANPSKLRRLKFVLERVNNVRKFRENSKGKETQKYASTPTLFRDLNNPETYIVFPRVSSERRRYIPFGFFDKSSIVADSCLFAPNANIYHFGVLTSEMHMSWVKCVSGRLKSDFRYSKDIVYNNFPFPKFISDSQKRKIENAAQIVLETRKQFPENSLADLYDPIAMPPNLVKAHQALDKAVDKCYRKAPFKNERERIEFLFELYEEYTAPLLKS